LAIQRTNDQRSASRSKIKDQRAKQKRRKEIETGGEKVRSRSVLSDVKVVLNLLPVLLLLETDLSHVPNGVIPQQDASSLFEKL